MKNAGGIIGIIAGVFGVCAALMTLLFGGVGAAFNADGAQTVVGLGWGGVFFSFLAIVCGAIVFSRPRGAGIGLVIVSILGAILGGTLVAIFMGLALIGGVLAIIGGTGRRSRPEQREGSPVAERSGKSAAPWLIGVAVVVLVVAGALYAGNRTSPSVAVDETAALAIAPVSNLRPDGELAAMFDLGSRYTDLQRENREKEIKGKVVQWRLPVYEVSKHGDKYRIQTASNGTIGAFVTITPRSAADRQLVEALHTGDLLSFKGIISDVSMRNLEIEPAILGTTQNGQDADQSHLSPASATSADAPSSPSVPVSTATASANGDGQQDEADENGPSAAPADSTQANTQSRVQDADAREADESGAAVGTVMTVGESGDDQTADTPFGKLSSSQDNVLLLDGKPVNPRVNGNDSLSFIAQVALKNRRAVLVQNNGGTACPAIYRWVIVSDGGYTVSPGFGSCSDLVKVSTAADSLIVTMPGFAGPFEAPDEQKSTARKRMQYVYDGKTVTENGKPIKG